MLASFGSSLQMVSQVPLEKLFGVIENISGLKTRSDVSLDQLPNTLDHTFVVLFKTNELSSWC